MDLISSVLNGGISGAIFSGTLMRLLFVNQLERSQRRLQHELDQEKQERRSQLEVFATIQKIRPVNYEQKNIEALELVYAAVVKTSLSRHNFLSTKRITIDSDELQETERYLN